MRTHGFCYVLAFGGLLLFQNTRVVAAVQFPVSLCDQTNETTTFEQFAKDASSLRWVMVLQSFQSELWANQSYFKADVANCDPSDCLGCSFNREVISIYWPEETGDCFQLEVGETYLVATTIDETVRKEILAANSLALRPYQWAQFRKLCPFNDGVLFKGYRIKQPSSCPTDFAPGQNCLTDSVFIQDLYKAAEVYSYLDSESNSKCLQLAKNFSTRLGFAGAASIITNVASHSQNYNGAFKSVGYAPCDTALCPDMTSDLSCGLTFGNAANINAPPFIFNSQNAFGNESTCYTFAADWPGSGVKYYLVFHSPIRCTWESVWVLGEPVELTPELWQSVSQLCYFHTSPLANCNCTDDVELPVGKNSKNIKSAQTIAVSTILSYDNSASELCPEVSGNLANRILVGDDVFKASCTAIIWGIVTASLQDQYNFDKIICAILPGGFDAIFTVKTSTSYGTCFPFCPNNVTSSIFIGSTERTERTTMTALSEPIATNSNNSWLALQQLCLLRSSANLTYTCPSEKQQLPNNMGCFFNLDVSKLQKGFDFEQLGKTCTKISPAYYKDRYHVATAVAFGAVTAINYSRRTFNFSIQCSLKFGKNQLKSKVEVTVPDDKDGCFSIDDHAVAENTTFIVFLDDSNQLIMKEIAALQSQMALFASICDLWVVGGCKPAANPLSHCYHDLNITEVTAVPSILPPIHVKESFIDIVSVSKWWVLFLGTTALFGFFAILLAFLWAKVLPLIRRSMLGEEDPAPEEPPRDSRLEEVDEDDDSEDGDDNNSGGGVTENDEEHSLSLSSSAIPPPKLSPSPVFQFSSLMARSESEDQVALVDMAENDNDQ